MENVLQFAIMSNETILGIFKHSDKNTVYISYSARPWHYEMYSLKV